jgi:hypothetical protein
MATLTKLQTHVRIVAGFEDNTSRVTPAVASTEGAGGTFRAWGIAGNTTNNVNDIYAPAVITLAANTGNTTDISNSTSSKTPLNTALTLARTKVIYIKLAQEAGHINGVLLNGSFANSHINTVHVIRPGGEAIFIDPTNTGTAVGASAKNIRLENLDVTNACNVSLTVIGGAT